MRFDVRFNQADHKLDVRLNQNDHKLDVRFNSGRKNFDVIFGYFYGVTAKHDYYEGKYEVTPSVGSQAFQTAQKIMKEDLTVKAIPCYDVSNSAGGSTIFIGNEV